MKSLLALLTSAVMALSLAGCAVPSWLPQFPKDEDQPGATEAFHSGGKYRHNTPGKEDEPEKTEKAPTGDQPVLNDKGEDIRDINVIVQEVIEGKYANGEERRKLLGDRYDKVMEKVNHRCLVERDPLCGAY